MTQCTDECADTTRHVLVNSVNALAVEHVRAAGMDWAEDLEEDAREAAREVARDMVNLLLHRLGLPLL